jgi:hypothetical protein
MSIVSPIYTATVNGSRLRFFKSPLQGHDFPWHSFMDLMEAAKLKEEHQLFFLRMVRGAHGEDTRVVPTSEGPVVIAPHYMAQGAIHATEELGFVSPKLENEYCLGMTGAVEAVLKHLPDQARFDAIFQMAKRHDSGEALR